MIPQNLVATPHTGGSTALLGRELIKLETILTMNSSKMGTLLKRAS